MIRAVEFLRNRADECEARAMKMPDKAVQAELVDICAEMHWLAGEATKLLKRIKQLEAA